MNFKEFIVKNYLTDPDLKTYKIVTRLLILNVVFFIFALLWMTSMISITNDLVQKEHVYNLDQEFSIEPTEYYPGTKDYWRNLEVKVPKRIYVYFAISGLAFLFWIEHIYYLFKKWFALRRKNL